ncbi:MAG: hypothetical protein OXC26_01665 [Albidovulum sp.]|nr:hypothetical protein [Albidovulum sp.]
MRSLAAAVYSELLNGLVEIEFLVDKQERHGPVACVVRQLEYAVLKHDLVGGSQIAIAENRAQKGD